MQPSDKSLEHPPGSRQLQTLHRHQWAPSCRNRHQRSRRSSSGWGVCRAGWSWAPLHWGQTGRGGRSPAPWLCCRRPCHPGTLPLRGREGQETVTQCADLPLEGCSEGGWGEERRPFDNERALPPSETIYRAMQGSRQTQREGEGSWLTACCHMLEWLGSQTPLRICVQEPGKKRWTNDTMKEKIRDWWPCLCWKKRHNALPVTHVKFSSTLHN